jgi:Ca-activated chloride channel family protein
MTDPVVRRTEDLVTAEARLPKGVLPARPTAHEPLLLRLTGGVPAVAGARTPIDLALVLDRSGSMRGEPLEAAKRAAHDAVDLLEDEDRVAIVAYDSDVELVTGPMAASRRGDLHDRIDAIEVRGMTALHAGWTEGAAQLVDLLDDARAARVVLLTDGLANVGVTTPVAIARDVGSMRAAGIVTSTVGLGRQFDEDLLTRMAEAGGGRFAYAESAAELEGIMATELIGIDATVARDVRLVLDVDPRRAVLKGCWNDFPRDGDAWILPDVVAELSVDVVLELAVREGGVAEDAALGSARLAWRDQGGQARRMALPLRAPVVDAERYAAAPTDPELAVATVTIDAARRRQRAMEALDRGDERAARDEVAAIERLLAEAPDAPAVQRERAALRRIHAALERHDAATARKHMAYQRESRRKGFDTDLFAHSASYSAKQEALAARRAQRERRGAQEQRPRHGEARPPSPRTGSGRPRASTDAWRQAEVPKPDGGTGVVSLLIGDITAWQGDAIVNSTNPAMHGTGASVDGAVHRVGGMELTRECRSIGHVGLGEAVVTRGGGLPVPYVLHTAVPEFDGSDKALHLLASCYRSAFELARQLRLGRVAVPAIGTGTNRFPVERAAEIAVREALKALARDGDPRRIELVLYDEATRQAFGRALKREAETRTAGSPVA